MFPSADRSCPRLRRFGLGFLLFVVPACGLSDYETLMREKAKKNEEHFRNEQKYLDEPVQIPTKKDKQGKDVPIANVFFRPPKGIAAKPEAEPRNDFLWRYPAQAKSGGDFMRVEMAFAAKDEDFAKKVLDSYRAVENFPAPPHDPPLPFDIYEFTGAENDAGPDVEHGYSINISKAAGMRVAIVYVFGKGKRDALRTAMDLSLQSLAVDQQSGIARLKYSQKSPWQLKPTP